MQSKKRTLCILGPTATGKTRTAALVAKTLGGEVISADSRQVYRRMDLGTGKDYEDYTVETTSVPVHLIDIVDPPQKFSLFDYARAFKRVFEEITGRDALPIVCGGSGLYLEAVLARYPLIEAPKNESLRAELTGLNMETLQNRLKSLKTPHNVTDLNNRERLIRAIEIADHARRHPEDSLELPKHEPTIFGIRWPRPLLQERIEKRLRERLEAGLIEEVEALVREGVTYEDLQFYGLEYRYVGAFVCDKMNRNDMFQKLRSAICKFAKRQETWFRRMERSGFTIEWLDGRDGPNKNSRKIISHWVSLQTP